MADQNNTRKEDEDDENIIFNISHNDTLLQEAEDAENEYEEKKNEEKTVEKDDVSGLAKAYTENVTDDCNDWPENHGRFRRKRNKIAPRLAARLGKRSRPFVSKYPIGSEGLRSPGSQPTYRSEKENPSVTKHPVICVTPFFIKWYIDFSLSWLSLSID